MGILQADNTYTCFHGEVDFDVLPKINIDIPALSTPGFNLTKQLTMTCSYTTTSVDWKSFTADAKMKHVASGSMLRYLAAVAVIQRFGDSTLLSAENTRLR